MAISAWNWTVSLESPDGSHNATIDHADEIGMGGPTSGELVISNGQSFPDCSPSIAWASNSRFLAVPQWQTGRRQRLLIISIEHNKTHLLDREYTVLEIESFIDDVVHGINSPAHNPTPVAVDTSNIEW